MRLSSTLSLAALQLQENSWLRWEADRIREYYDADKVRIADLETFSGQIKTRNNELEATVSGLQAERISLVKQLAFTRKTRKLLRVCYILSVVSHNVTLYKSVCLVVNT